MYTDGLRIQVERALRRAFIERARECPLHLVTLKQLRNLGLMMRRKEVLFAGR